MDLSEAAEALYGLPRVDFTPARDEQVRAARAAGDRALAAAIGKLRRPTVAAWLANSLAREQPDAVADLFDLGEALRAAHRDLDGAALRELSQRRHALVNELLGSIKEIGRDAGQPVNEPALRELEEMYTAALASPEAGQVAASGRLAATKDVADPAALSWPGVDPDATPRPARPRTARPPRLRPAPNRAATAPAPEPVAEPAGHPGSGHRAEAPPDPALARARMKARAELDRLTRSCEQAETTLAEARQGSEATARAEDAAHRRVAALRAELTVAEREEQRGRESARAARRAADDADRALREARRRQEIAEQRLAALGE